MFQSLAVIWGTANGFLNVTKLRLQTGTITSVIAVPVLNDSRMMIAEPLNPAIGGRTCADDGSRQHRVSGLCAWMKLLLDHAQQVIKVKGLCQDRIDLDDLSDRSCRS